MEITKTKLGNLVKIPVDNSFLKSMFYQSNKAFKILDGLDEDFEFAGVLMGSEANITHFYFKRKGSDVFKEEAQVFCPTYKIVEEKVTEEDINVRK